MNKTLRWGIIGTGFIAHVFAKGLSHSKTSTLVAVGSRSQDTADAFGETWHVPRRYGSYTELLQDSDVEAVYISTPHPLHAEWAIKTAKAGKHILCEKPLTLNVTQAEAVIEAARNNDVFLMEAFMYRCHPQTAKLVELIRSGVIGQVRVIQATFSFQSEDNPDSRLLNNALGGGGILDVGCYCTSIARLIAGAAIGQRFSNPLHLSGTGHIGKTQVDEYAVATLLFPDDIIAQLFSGVRVNGGSHVHIYGSEGNIYLPQPFTPHLGEQLCIFVQKDERQEPQSILVENNVDLYALEADTVAQYLAQRQAPAMDWEDTLGNMRTLDQWRAAVGVTYSANASQD